MKGRTLGAWTDAVGGSGATEEELPQYREYPVEGCSQPGVLACSSERRVLSPSFWEPPRAGEGERPGRRRWLTWLSRGRLDRERSWALTVVGAKE